MTGLIILDNEAIQALASPSHRKHRHALAYLQVIASRKQRAIDIQTVVPTTVRVEAGTAPLPQGPSSTVCASPTVL
jgi:hypothetical protein